MSSHAFVSRRGDIHFFRRNEPHFAQKGLGYPKPTIMQHGGAMNTTRNQLGLLILALRKSNITKDQWLDTMDLGANVPTDQQQYDAVIRRNLGKVVSSSIADSLMSKRFASMGVYGENVGKVSHYLSGGKFEDYIETDSGFQKPRAGSPKKKAATPPKKQPFLAVPDDPARPSTARPSAPTPSKFKDLPIADPSLVSIVMPTPPTPSSTPTPVPTTPTPSTQTNDLNTELLKKMYERLGDIDSNLVTAVQKQLQPVADNGPALSPVQMAELYDQLLNSPELTMMVKLGLIKWTDLVKSGKKELDYEYITKMKQSLDTFSRQQKADDLRNVQFRKRQDETAGFKPSRGGPFGPNVVMYQPAHYPPPELSDLAKQNSLPF